MVLEIKNLRYAHAAGHTDVCYGSDSRHILTCGSDGNVRIWDGSDDDDPSADFVSEVTLAVACSKDQFFVATDNNYVQAYTFPERKRDKIIFRFSAPVTYITVSSSGKYLAACSCDMEVQVIDTESNKITTLTGHTGPVLGVFLDPMEEFLVSSSCDGTIKIWEIAEGSLVKTLADIVPVKNDFFKANCLGRSAWKSISGSVLAVPKDLEVLVYKRGTWEVTYKLISKKIQKPLSVVLFSPCGNYVTAASVSGEIVIWEIKHKSEVCYYEDPKKVGISGIAWHPDGSEIALADRLGRLGILTDINQEISKHVIPGENAETDDFKYGNDMDEINEDIDTNALFDDDGNDENCISLEKIKALYKNSDDEEEGGLKSPESVASSETTKEPVVPLPKPQPSFQPSSTPSHFEPRCLCYNSIGMVRYYDSDKTIDVQFHDTMFHHALFLRSFGMCTMASLSTNVLCLAVPSVDENLSKLTCIPLSSWAGSKEWTIHLPENEDIMAVAAAGTWVAAATSANHMRIFTHSGIQKQIIALPGPVVSMSGHEQRVFVVCHMGMGLINSQNLGYIIYQISNLCVRVISPFQPLPLFPKSVLRWVGFSDEGTPCTYDSEGIIRLLGHDLLHWSVACDTRNQKKSPSDHYFIIGLSEKYQNVRCVLCRNTCYPLIINTPTVVEIPLKIPLCDLDTEKSLQEETFWRLMFSLSTLEKISAEKPEYQSEVSSLEQTLKQTALKLFADACRNSEDLRALDVATFMSSHPLEVAVKYASKVGKMYLAEKLNGISPMDWRNQYPEACIKTFSVSRETESTFGDTVDSNVYSQQDLFEDYSSNSGKENIALEKSNKADVVTMESPETPKHLSVNPFKKVHTQPKGAKGLEFFDTLTKESSKASKPHFHSKPLKLKPLGRSKEKESGTKGKNLTFVQWFSCRKALLTEEYPNVSPSELTKLGMKLYRQELSRSSNECQSVDNNESDINKRKKQELEDSSGSETKRPKTSDESSQQ